MNEFRQRSDDDIHQPCLMELKLNNILSFGPDSKPIELMPLNVIIGPNGSGKSNLIEAISLLRAAPKDLSAPVKEAGGVRDWLWKGANNPEASIDVIMGNPDRDDMPVRHSFSFIEHGMRFEVTSEKIENKEAHPSYDSPYFYYSNERGYIKLKEKPPYTSTTTSAPGSEEDRQLPRETINPEESVLSQVRDPERYPILAYLADIYSQFKLYREWTFGRYTNPRQAQKSDLPNKYLLESFENLPLVLNYIRRFKKNELIDTISKIYSDFIDFNIDIVSGWVQLLVEEKDYTIPATRLSDGTLRYLCLCAILCHPEPPPLVCIEEPELGLHPDILPQIARMLIEASSRCQLIVTTHSDILVDALSETPESVIVCEKERGQTQMRRLDKSDLARWLKDYRLGELWLKGEIGGLRW